MQKYVVEIKCFYTKFVEVEANNKTEAHRQAISLLSTDPDAFDEEDHDIEHVAVVPVEDLG
jgi:hypothetical protein